MSEHPWVPEHMYVDWDRPHLGGYFEGGDPGSFYPEMWRWLVETEGIHSVVDVGCGSGQAIGFFRDELGCRVLGIEGIEQPDRDIVTHDYTEGPYFPTAIFDLAWSCEFVEHVEEQYVPNFFATFDAARLLLMTHAQPGQGGHHHVNCQTDFYWIERLQEIGFMLDVDLTRKTHELVKNGYWLWSGMAFRRT